MTVAKSAAGALLNGVHVEMGQLLHRARTRAPECVGQRAVRRHRHAAREPGRVYDSGVGLYCV